VALAPTNPSIGSNAPISGWQSRLAQMPGSLVARYPVSSKCTLWLEYHQTRTAGTPLLNVRTGPGADFPSLGKLPGGYNQIHIIGTQLNGTTEWAHIVFEKYSGCVNKKYLRSE
jgi:uncharacterized protein YraI